MVTLFMRRVRLSIWLVFTWLSCSAAVEVLLIFATELRTAKKMYGTVCFFRVAEHHNSNHGSHSVQLCKAFTVSILNPHIHVLRLECALEYG